MFTGIVTAVGTIATTRQDERGLELTIAAPYEDLEPGESIAVDGACLTVERAEKTERSEKAERLRLETSPSSPPFPSSPSWTFTVHIVGPSLDRTLFRGYAIGRRVNLERALRVGDRMGGHIVQGHVDGTGSVLRVEQEGDSWLMDIEVPPAIAAVTIPLGSITVDGVSLTVNATPAPGQVQVSLIPFTLQHTTLGESRPGSQVHLEGDVLGKYVAALLAPHQAGR